MTEIKNINTQNELECCPKFDPKPYDNVVHEWKEKKFVKGKVWTFFYMPINFGGVMSKLDRLIRDAGGTTENLGLSEHTSKWNMDIYIAVDKEIKGVENTAISGKYLSRVYEGDFKNTGQWCNDFDDYSKANGLNISKQYMWYTTCPKCAKKYGKNYTVIFGKVE